MVAKSKKLQKFCRIFQWVEIKDEDFAGAIRDLCMEGAISSGRSGATFLFPSAKIRKEIIEKAYSPDAEKAIDLLNAHIISASVQNANAFKLGVGSRRRIKLEVIESSGDSTVTLKGGCKLEVASDFLPLKKDNIAVWEVKSGEVPTEGDVFEGAKSGRGEYYHGGAALSTGNVVELSSRSQLATNVEAEYNTCMINSNRCVINDPYLSKSVSLLNFLKRFHPDLFQSVLPIIDRDPTVTFYLLIEPYKQTGDRLIHEDILFGTDGWNGIDNYEGAVSEFEAFFDDLAKINDPSATDVSSGNQVVPYVFKDVEAVRKAIDAIRGDMVDGNKISKVTTPTEIHKAYEELIAKNSIGATGPILPDSTLLLFSNFKKKLWQDEFRFVLHQRLNEIRNAPSYDPESFSDILLTLRVTMPGNDYAKEAPLSNSEMLLRNVAPRKEFYELLTFLNSTDFLYIPVPEEKIGGAWGAIPTTESTNDDPREEEDSSVLNTEAAKSRLLHKYKAEGLNSPHKPDKGCIAAVLGYMSRSGLNPDEL